MVEHIWSVKDEFDGNSMLSCGNGPGIVGWRKGCLVRNIFELSNLRSGGRFKCTLAKAPPILFSA